jgi:hypothetical protein
VSVVNPCTVGLRAFIIGMTRRRRAAAGTTACAATGTGAASRQPPNTPATTLAARAVSTSPTMTTDNSDGANLAA